MLWDLPSRRRSGPVPNSPGILHPPPPRSMRSARWLPESCGMHRLRRVGGLIRLGVGHVLRPPGPRLLDAVGDQLAIQRRSVDPQDVAGLLLLPARVVQDLEDVFLL